MTPHVDALVPVSLSPDLRWRSFVSTRDDLIRLAATWPVAKGAPTSVTEMLAVSRELFCHSWFVYDFLMVGAVQSLIAVEAALRNALDERPRRGGPTMRNLVEQASGRGLVDAETAEVLVAGTELRNAWLHVDGARVITPGMGEQVIGTSHVVTSAIYSGATRE